TLYKHSFVFLFNVTLTALFHSLSLHDALPISGARSIATYNARVDKVLSGEMPPEKLLRSYANKVRAQGVNGEEVLLDPVDGEPADRKSTRLNSSHVKISYAVLCLKKKKAQ